jgi:hypothetical protein
MKGVPQGANCDIFLEIFYIFTKMEKADQSLTLSTICFRKPTLYNHVPTITRPKNVSSRYVDCGLPPMGIKAAILTMMATVVHTNQGIIRFGLSLLSC